MARSKALMENHHHHHYYYYSLSFGFLVLLLLVTSSSAAVPEAAVVSGSVVKFLPGFEGPLPFHLETGYVGVGERSEEAQVFYYFIKSERDDREDPLMLWLTGGPGCSGLSGLVFEIGPINFKVAEYNGSLPILVSNPHSWTQMASIIFVDLPIGTGFSYATTPNASKSGDFIQIHQAVQFLRKWLMGHPEFLQNPVYIGGDSYSGITLPAMVQLLSLENEEGIEPLINLKGYLLGNPGTDPVIEQNSVVPFAHGKGLISDELYESLKTNCGGNYQMKDPSNADCLRYLQEYYKCISGIDGAQILEPLCAFFAPKPVEIAARRRSLDDESRELMLDFDPQLPTLGCRTYAYLLAAYWIQDNNVQKALNIREGSIKKWVRCNYEIPYTHDIDSSTKYHFFLGMRGYRSLVYSGDHDMLVPFLGTQAWIRSLNYSIVDDWRPWYLNGQIAGYTRTYSNQMTFATVKGGGHTAPEYTPAECFAMFKRWILEEPL